MIHAANDLHVAPTFSSVSVTCVKTVDKDAFVIRVILASQSMSCQNIV